VLCCRLDVSFGALYERLTVTAPVAVLICGANGSGKTTFARRLLPLLHPGVAYQNVDEIQREAAPFLSPTAAAREFIRRLRLSEQTRLSFALETTLASRRFLSHIRRWQGLGYRVTIHFIEVPSEEFALVRVAQRVAAGGHDVPDVDVRRRFARGRALFFGAFQGLADAWYHWYSDDDGLRLLERRSP
jgi:predicted ABC-type ATPase